MKISWLVPYLLLLSLVLPSEVCACVVRYRSADELRQEASIVITATVLALEVSQQSSMGELYSYKIRIKSTERGRDLPKLITVSYYNVRARVRDGVTVCPLKDGSGSETNLKLNGEYKFFLKDSSAMEILFSELLG
jgi:hypothetical protein